MSKQDEESGSARFTTQGIQVAMTDTFMSGWGQSKNAANILVIECDTQEDAETVERNAKLRTEMTDVRIIHGTKHWPDNVVVSLKHFDELGPIWKKPEVSDDD